MTSVKKYKLMEVAWDKKYEKAEQLMNEMSEQGWDVVSVSSDFQRSVKLLITFCKEVNT